MPEQSTREHDELSPSKNYAIDFHHNINQGMHTIDDQTENRSINTHQTPSLPTTTKMQNQVYENKM